MLKEEIVSQIIGIVIMIVSAFLLRKYFRILKDEMKDLGKYWWFVIVGEIFLGASAIFIVTFVIGFLLVIKPV